jgi:hypothetical protein
MTVGILELCDEVPLEENLVAVVVVHSRSVHARSSIRAVYQSGATIGQSAFRLINRSSH